MADERVNLTQRDRQVLQLVALGRTNGEIADELGISFSTAKWHISQLLMKVNVRSREELAQFWETERDLRRRFSRAIAGLLPFGSFKIVAVSSVAALVAVSVAGVLAIRAASGDLSISSGLAVLTGSPSAPTVPEFETQRGNMIHGADITWRCIPRAWPWLTPTVHFRSTQFSRATFPPVPAHFSLRSSCFCKSATSNF